MNKYQRAKRRIARDKELKRLKHNALYLENDNFKSVMTMQHLCDALVKCRKGVNWKGTVQSYTQHAIIEMYHSYSSLQNGKLPNLTSTSRIILYERGKKREIVPITIKDRMIQRVLCDNTLVPVLKNRLIYDNGASMKDKGVEFTRKRLNKHLQTAIKEYGSNFYALTFDFKGFFDSIPHRTCLNVLKDSFNDKYIQGLTMAIIKSYEKATIQCISDNALRTERLKRLNNNSSKGICLGSQVSQIMALAAPNKLDHFLKDLCGVKHYIRYMDDGIILSNDKEFLWNLYDQMKVICEELGLTFNTKKTRIVKVSRGFVFMKVRYRVTSTGKIVRTLTRAGIVRMRRKLKKFRRMVDAGKITLDDVYNSVQSWLAHSKVALSYNTKRSMLALYNQLFDGYRITKKWEHMKGGKNGELLQIDKWRDFRWNCDAA